MAVNLRDNYVAESETIIVRKPGTECQMKASGNDEEADAVSGRIIRVELGVTSGVRHEVAWWNGRARVTAWLTEMELMPANPSDDITKIGFV